MVKKMRCLMVSRGVSRWGMDHGGLS